MTDVILQSDGFPIYASNGADFILQAKHEILVQTSNVRQYKIQLEGNNQTPFATVTRDEALRPHVGEQIRIASRPWEIFKVTRTIPLVYPCTCGFLVWTVACIHSRDTTSHQFP